MEVSDVKNNKIISILKYESTHIIVLITLDSEYFMWAFMMTISMYFVFAKLLSL